MLDSLPDAARVWLVSLDQTLTDSEADALGQTVSDWLPSWKSHGRPVHAQAEVLASRVLAIGAVISEAEFNGGVSGCGIDAMEHAVAGALDAHEVGRAPALGITFRDDDGAWQTLARPAFRRLVRGDAAGPSTRILDVTPTTVGALREGGVERPAGATWAARAFALAA